MDLQDGLDRSPAAQILRASKRVTARQRRALAECGPNGPDGGTRPRQRRVAGNLAGLSPDHQLLPIPAGGPTSLHPQKERTPHQIELQARLVAAATRVACGDTPNDGGPPPRRRPRGHSANPESRPPHRAGGPSAVEGKSPGQPSLGRVARQPTVRTPKRRLRARARSERCAPTNRICHSESQPSPNRSEARVRALQRPQGSRQGSSRRWTCRNACEIHRAWPSLTRAPAELSQMQERPASSCCKGCVAIRQDSERGAGASSTAGRALKVP